MFRIVILIFFCTELFCDLFPEYESRLDAMACKKVKLAPGIKQNKAPKKIHQIWFGDINNLDKSKCEEWQKFALKFGYEYQLWTEENNLFFKQIMFSRNYEFLQKMLNEKNYRAASDILRYELIKNIGGLYIDCDFRPPTLNGDFADLETFFNFNDLVLMAEQQEQNVHECAIFLSNSFILSAPNHPVISSIVEQLYDNAQSWHSKYQSYEAKFVTGAFLLNKVINGSYHVVPCTFLKELNMLNYTEVVHLLPLKKDSPFILHQTLRNKK